MRKIHFFLIKYYQLIIFTRYLKVFIIFTCYLNVFIIFTCYIKVKLFHRKCQIPFAPAKHHNIMKISKLIQYFIPFWISHVFSCHLKIFWDIISHKCPALCIIWAFIFWILTSNKQTLDSIYQIFISSIYLFWRCFSGLHKH